METTPTADISTEKQSISEFVHLVSDIFSVISPLFLKNKTLYSLTEVYRVMESVITSRVHGRSKNTAKCIYLDKEKIDELLKNVSALSPILEAEFSMFFFAQKVVVALDEENNVLDKFCYTDKRNQGVFCVDPVILDVVYLLRDITATIKMTMEKENEGTVTHLMNVFAEKPKMGKHISFKKLFMIASVLMRGFKEEDVNLTDITEGIISRIDPDGMLTVKRKPWKKLAVEERKKSTKATTSTSA